MVERYETLRERAEEAGVTPEELEAEERARRKRNREYLYARFGCWLADWGLLIFVGLLIAVLVAMG